MRRLWLADSSMRIRRRVPLWSPAGTRAGSRQPRRTNRPARPCAPRIMPRTDTQRRPETPGTRIQHSFDRCGRKPWAAPPRVETYRVGGEIGKPARRLSTDAVGNRLPAASVRSTCFGRTAIFWLPGLILESSIPGFSSTVLRRIRLESATR